MKLTQELIEEAVKKYNELTEAHKRAPVLAYVNKQLLAGEQVDMLSGSSRWSSALRFSGSPEKVIIELLINPNLPEIFKKQLLVLQKEFSHFIDSRL